jgi:transcriptional regulator with XRE-family HTH domain
MDAEALGHQVQWARRRAGMTQHQVAQAVGMPQSTIARVEKGTVSPLATTLISILRATGHRITVEPIGDAAASDDVSRWAVMPVPGPRGEHS